MTVIGLLLVIYFVREQYSFERPKRISYLLIPIYSIFMFLTTYKVSKVNIYLAIIILIFGICVGVFQGKAAKIQQYTGESGKQRVKIKGGTAYLLGWIAIVAAQILIEVFFAHHNMNGNEIFREIGNSIEEELMPFSKVHKGGLWSLWILTGGSSLIYTLTLAHRSSEFRQTIQRGSRKQDRRAMKKRKKNEL